MNAENTAMTPAAENAVAETATESIGTRFTKKVLAQFASNTGSQIAVTEFQRRLIQGYFIQIDRALAVAEEARVAKNAKNRDHKWDETLPVTWKFVNLQDLAMDLVRYARMGLDMQCENMLFPIPYKNNKTNLYDVTLMPGYNGIRYVAMKYALHKPKADTIELVYSNDKFAPHPKDSRHPVASYEFEITNPFDRGDIVGGFGYLEYDDPTQNELIVMPMAAIRKRMPKYASAEFWGGTKQVYNKETGKKEDTTVEGWLDEMCRKTLIREVFSAKHIVRDPEKLDEDYRVMKAREIAYAEIQAEAEIQEQANTVLIDTAPQPAAPASLPESKKTIQVDASTGEVLEPKAAPAAKPTSRKAAPAQWDVAEPDF